MAKKKTRPATCVSCGRDTIKFNNQRVENVLCGRCARHGVSNLQEELDRPGIFPIGGYPTHDSSDDSVEED